MDMARNPGFLFPGQGVQKVGMSNRLVNNGELRKFFLGANEVLGFDITRLITEGPEEELSLTKNAQPAILIDGVARYNLMIENGFTPSIMLGHSLGEFTTLVAAGCISYEEGLQLVRKRGELTNDLNSRGSMVAVLGLNYKKVESALGELEEQVTIANYNSPEQIVLSGKESHLERGCKLLQENGAKCIKLNVSGPFHSPLMKDAESRLANFIEGLEFSDPEVPIISSVSGELESSGERVKELISKQMTHSVNWISTIQKLAAAGVDTTIEVGPDSTLKRLTDRIGQKLDNKTFNEVM